MVALIILAVILVITISIVVSCSIIKHKRTKFVLSNSSFISTLSEINEKYNFYTDREKEIKIVYVFKTKAKYDRFAPLKAVEQAFKDYQFRIKTSVEKLARTKALLKHYRDDISRIEKTDYKSLPECKLLNEAKYYRIEKKIANRKTKKPDLSFSIIVRWSYTSPAGRNHYEQYLTLDYEKTVNYYAYFFGTNLDKAEENDYIEKAVKAVIESMTESGYSTTQIVNLFKNYGINANKELVVLTAEKAGFVKSKRSDIFVKANLGSVADLILQSSEENGLIRYENSIKDEKYDDAIYKLEKDRKIVPISNLLFLKLDDSLSYDGLSLEDIKTFDARLRDYAFTHRYLSVKSVQDTIKCKITELPYDEIFLYSLLKNSGFLCEVPGIKKLFTIGFNPIRLDFLTYLIGSNKSVNAFNLIQAVKDTYGVEYTIYSIIYDIENGDTVLYYNNETEKIYSNKEYFYEEIL